MCSLYNVLHKERVMDNKLLILCVVMAFIIGMYTTVLITKDRGCTVTYKHGDSVTVTLRGK
jgi:hypothetical protein